MALEQHKTVRNPDARAGGADILFRPIPLLVGLWRQLGSEPAVRTGEADSPELFAALQSEIIPRLMIASRLPPPPVIEPASGLEVRGTAFNAGEHQAFLAALLSSSDEDAARLARSHLARGHELATLMIELFAVAARELGEMWNEDEVSFVDVTIGVCRLHQIVHDLAGVPEPEPEIGASGNPGILIASAPGEQHVFGVLIASELFRQNDWTVVSETSGDPGAILRQVSNHRFDIAGISASNDSAVASLPQLVRTLRNSSLNPDLKVLVGGPLFERSPQLAREIGADAIAGRGLDAPDHARKLLAI